MEDETVVLLHEDDIGDRTSVMAIEGYLENDDGGAGGGAKEVETEGDINFRGEREWSSGGATVCCNRCCSVLGYASLQAPESIRLYKHRLVCGEDEEGFRGYTVGSFLAREMAK